MSKEKKKENLRRMLTAKSVAVVGASNNPDKWGYKYIDNLHKGGYEGIIYPINSREETILGEKVYKTVLDVPGEIDLMIITVPLKAVNDVIRQGIEKGVPGAALITSGYREMGRRDLELEILDIIKDTDFRILGPNIPGFNMVPNKLNAAVVAVLERMGPIGIISQSGSISATASEWMDKGRVGLSGLVNLGNEIDISETELLDFYRDQEETKVITMYLEGIKDKEDFKKMLPAVCQEKPVVIMKPGRSSLGKRVSGSHTASIAGDDDIFTAACAQYGAVRVYDLEAFYDTSRFFGLNPLPKGNRVFCISSSGGIAGLIADEMAASGLDMPLFDAKISEEIEANVTLAGSNFRINPVDLPCFTPQEYCTTLEIVDKYDIADMYLLALADPVPGIEDMLPELAKKTGKPVAVIYCGGGEAEEVGALALQEQGVATYSSPERAVRSMSRAVWYVNRKEELRNE